MKSAAAGVIFRRTICDFISDWEERVDRGEIPWPWGKTEILTDLLADHFFGVKEGEGIVPRDRLKPVPQTRH